MAPQEVTATETVTFGDDGFTQKVQEVKVYYEPSKHKLPLAKRSILAIVLGFFEGVCFGGFGGWTMLVYAMKKDGIFGSSCHPPAETYTSEHMAAHIPQVGQVNYTVDHQTSMYAILRMMSSGRMLFMAPALFSSNDTHYDVCLEQDNNFALANTIGSSLMAFAAFPIGLVFDRCGLFVTRIFAVCVGLPSLLMLAFADAEHSWLVYSGFPLFAISMITVNITNNNICNLLGDKASTGLAIYTGGYCASAIMWLFVKIGSDFGFPRQYGMLIHAGLWLIHIFSTVFVLPRFKVINPAEAERLQSSVAVTVYTIPIKTMAPPEQPKDPEKMATQCLGQEAKVRPKGRNAVSFRASACTLIFLSSVYWFGVIDLRNLYFGSSFNAWTTHVMRGDLSRVSLLSNMYGVLSFSSIILSPITGILIDRRRRHLTELGLIGQQKAMGALLPLVMTSLVTILLSFFALLETEWSVLICIVLSLFVRAFLYATGFAFIQLVFPLEHQGKLLGLMYMFGGFLYLLQYVFFSWATQINNYLPSNMVIALLATLTLVHPLNVWWQCRRRAKGSDNDSCATYDTYL